MSIDQTVSEHNVIDFRSTVELAAQQLDSVLWDCVDTKDCEGTQASPVKLFDAVTASERPGRVPKNQDNRANRRRRWLKYRNPVQSGEYIEDEDMWRQAYDATSDLMVVHMAAIARFRDERIIEGLFGEAYEGEDGPKTTKNLPAINVIPATLRDEDDTASGNIGLNIKKMREARKLLKKSEIFQVFPSERPKFGVTAEQVDDMMQYTKVTSVDFADRSEEPILLNGRFTRFMGFDLVECERWGLKSGTTDIRLNAAWIPRAVKKGIWSGVRSRIWNDGSRNNTPIFNIDIAFDCRRIHDEGVIQVECFEG